MRGENTASMAETYPR